MKLLPISRPAFPPDDELFDVEVEFRNALRAGRVTNHGPHVQELERRLAARLGVRHVVCVSSGTAALVVMLKAAGVRPGDEVIVPSFTFCATPHAVALAGAVPVFADVEATTGMLDPQDVERRITPRTKAIMPVDVYGEPYPAGWLLGFMRPGSDRAAIDILADSAPSFGAVPSGGAPPRARAYSFHATKPFSTMEGGCIATDDEGIASRAAKIAHFGIWPSGLAQVVGTNAHMLEVSALVGLAALPLLDEALRRRRAVVSRYFFGLRESGVRFLHVPDVLRGTWCYFPILLANESRREQVRFRLEARGVEARPYYVECHTMPAYKSQTPLPATEGLSRRVLALPVYSDQSDEEAAYVIDAVKEAVL